MRLTEGFCALRHAYPQASEQKRSLSPRFGAGLRVNGPPQLAHVRSGIMGLTYRFAGTPSSDVAWSR